MYQTRSDETRPPILKRPNRCTCLGAQQVSGRPASAILAMVPLQFRSQERQELNLGERFRAGANAAGVKACERLGYGRAVSCGIQVAAFDPVECLKPAIEARQAKFIASAVPGGNEETANLSPKLLTSHVARVSTSSAPSARTDREAAAISPHLPNDVVSAMLDSSSMTEIAQAERPAAFRQEGFELSP